MLTAPLLASVIRDALHHFQSEDKDVVKGCCWSAGCLWSGLGGSGVLGGAGFVFLAVCSALLRLRYGRHSVALVLTHPLYRAVPSLRLRRAAGSAGRGGAGLPGVLWWVFWFGDMCRFQWL